MILAQPDVAQLCPLPGTYHRFDASVHEGQSVTAWISRDADDPAWDRFLEQTPLGQFQQSTTWARAKAVEGWQSLRLLILQDNAIIGGFQILIRPLWRGRGRIGYISKGPVLLPGHSWAPPLTARLLQRVLRQEKLSAVIAQPPDLCPQMSGALHACGFMQDFLMKVNDATWITDLDGDFSAIEASMGRTTRNLVRRAIKAGVTVRQGTREDLPRFFELMLATCQRQQAQPNPSELRHLEALWDAAFPAGRLQLFLAEHDGKVLAGLLAILFGQTATLWKVGAAPPDREMKPNDLMYREAMRWANQHGYRHCDFAAFDRRVAESLLKGEDFPEEKLRTRYLFLTRFGGRPCLLPSAQVYFPSPLGRAAYRARFRRQLRAASFPRPQ